MKLPSLPMVVLDTETTGLLPKVNRIIEFASVRIENGELQEPYEQLFSIPNSIPPHVHMLTRIADADIDGKPTFEELSSDVLSHIGEDTIIVGQNVGFDIRMLKGEGIDLTDRPWFDTSMIASLVFPELASYSLGYMSKVLQLHHEPVHRALGDVNATIELLSKCWERFCELPEKEMEVLRTIMQKAPEGYRKLFACLPEKSTAHTTPSWLRMPEPDRPESVRFDEEFSFSKPEKGSVQVLDEPLSQGFLQNAVRAIEEHASDMHWIAVKNLHSAVRALQIPEEMLVLYPAFSLLDDAPAKQLLSQEEFSTDEATLAVKLHWYKPKRYEDIPIHGDEKAVWNGRLSCTANSKAYTDQFLSDAGMVLIDHKQLLEIVSDPEHPGHKLLQKDVHILIDDASMLEDTATKSYGWFCALDSVRAAAASHEELTKFTDVLQLWIEKTRNSQDVRYITPGDLQTPEARGLREQLDGLLSHTHIQEKELILKHLKDLAHILNPEELKDRICWIEQRQNGSQFLQSVPDRVGDLLRKHLYDVYSVTLCIPPQSDTSLAEILPAGMDVLPAISTMHLADAVSIEFSGQTPAEEFLADPPKGKTVLLVGSRGRIDDIYVRFTKELEEKNITLICQGFGGGSGRMQAEFAAETDTTIWVITPWIFETIEVPYESIDHLVIDALPFDHPAHPVFSLRCEHYRNAFMEYSMPRLLQRLYRILRTFCKYRSPEGDVVFLDKRIEEKRYGKDVWNYMRSLRNEKADTEKTSGGEEGQLTMF